MLPLQTTETERRFAGNLSVGVFLFATLASVTVVAEEHGSFAMPFHISVIQADTIVNGKGDNATLGIDMEYRVNSLLGLGAVIEYAWGELDATTVLAVADIHLTEGWVMQIGPGVEYSHNEEIFVSRLGLIYEFEFNHYTFAPQVHWDYHDGEKNSVVAGFAVGFSF